jgi:hypothetical protein
MLMATGRTILLLAEKSIEFALGIDTNCNDWMIRRAL